MPDLDNREEYEAAVALMLLMSNEPWGERFIELAGWPPDPRNIPPDTWPEIEDAIQENTTDAFAMVSLAAFGGIQAELGWQVEAEHMALVLLIMAQEEADTLAQLYTASTRRQITQAARRAAREVLDGLNEAEAQRRWLASVAELTGTERAERAAIGEVTDAISRAEQEYRRQVAERFGVVLAPFWMTEYDDRVCPICEPLHEQPEEVWVQDYPNGPKAHFGCRCWLKWEVVEEPMRVGDAA